MAETASESEAALIVFHEHMPDVLKVAVRLLASLSATNEAIEAAGELVAEQARFDIWCVRSAKGSLDEAALEEVFELAEDVDNAVSQEWERCIASQSSLDAMKQLECTLRDWTARLREIRVRVRDRSET